MADVARKTPAARPRCPRRRIDPHPLRHGEVDRQALVPGGRPGPFCPPPRVAIGGLLSRPKCRTRESDRLAPHGSAPEALVGQSLRVYRVAALAKMADVPT